MIITIEGSRIKDIDTFYDEIQTRLCPDFEGFGRNLMAFDDILYGGFNVFEYKENIELAWKDSEVSRKALGYNATVEYYKYILKTAHPTNRVQVKGYIADARRGKGPTFFDNVESVIEAHDHIKFQMR